MKIKKLNIKKVTPTFTRIITTADSYSEAESYDSAGLLIPGKEGQIKDIQRIVFSGDSAIQRGFAPGQLISLDFRAYEVRKHAKNALKDGIDEEYNPVTRLEIPMLTLDAKPHLYLDANDVEFIIDDYDEVEVEVNVSGLLTTGSPIIS